MTLEEMDRLLDTVKLGLVSLAMRDELPRNLGALDMDEVYDEGKRLIMEGQESWQ